MRLFQRKFKWLNEESIVYDKLAADLKPLLAELLTEAFLIDENAIDSYEEIIYLFKLPQLKEIAKVCHVVNPSQSVKLRSEFIKLILQHFSSQKCLKFHLKSNEILNSQTSSSSSSSLAIHSNKSQFMLKCKQTLGKCYKLNKTMRDVFVRVLMMYSLSSTHRVDPAKKESGQETLYKMICFVLVKNFHF